MEHMDGVIAAPDHHKVVFENERIRLVELNIAPGETVPMHTHRWASVNYLIEPSDFLSIAENGDVRVDSRELTSGNEAGSVVAIPAFPPVHSVKNIGDVTMRGIAIEIKD